MAPKKKAEGKSKDTGGAKGGKGKDDAKVKGAQRIVVRHILVRLHNRLHAYFSFCLGRAPKY